MAEFFHNPYHFVPVKEGTRPDDLTVENFKQRNTGHVTHARYMTSRDGTYYSGRLICRLTTETPTVIGDKQEPLPDESHKVTPFVLRDKPAIPASSLRGLVSSISEAASNSALRILEKKRYSRRAAARGESLSAIGMIVQETEPSGKKVLKLRPLVLPTMEATPGGAPSLPREYRKMFPTNRTPPLKVYVGDYNSIRSTAISPDLPLNTFARESPQYFYAKLYPRKWNADYSLARDTHLKLTRGRFLVAQESTDGLAPIPESRLPANRDSRAQYTRGILRVLGVHGRTRQIPINKRHELFIPYPGDVASIPTFPIAPEALNDFHTLADERTDATAKKAKSEEELLPFHPRGTLRNADPANDGKYFRLKDGDLVYFRPNKTGDAVDEVSLSAIWRKPIPGDSHEYFGRISSELLPFDARIRHQVTIAEQLFGFAEEEAGTQGVKDTTNKQEVGEKLALASRVRFSFGEVYPDPGKDYYLPETLLKVLDSPKPPYPSFYFTKRGSAGFIPKDRLRPDEHVPQGRKFYLHDRYSATNPPWETQRPDDNLGQKSRVTPLKRGLSFYFHIDFFNLSVQELGLLCYALRPSDSFKHKLGMGKPIGLGTVRVDPVAIFYVDREKRYRQDIAIFETRRYHGAWIQDGEQPPAWPPDYGAEQRESDTGRNGFPSFKELRDKASKTMDADISQAIELLGDPANVQKPVHTPQLANVAADNLEMETFKWFVGNTSQYLQPIDKNTRTLQQLRRLE